MAAARARHRFTVLAYNVLANHCGRPEYFVPFGSRAEDVAWSSRFPRLRQHIVDSSADLLLLSEIDRVDDSWGPFFKDHGFEWVFLPRTAQVYGSMIAWRAASFACEAVAAADYNALADAITLLPDAETAPWAAPFDGARLEASGLSLADAPAAPVPPAVEFRRNCVALFAALRLKPQSQDVARASVSPGGARGGAAPWFAACATHLFWRPDADHTRLAQAAMLQLCAADFVAHVASKMRTTAPSGVSAADDGAAAPSMPPTAAAAAACIAAPLIIGGDLNAPATTAAYRTLALLPLPACQADATAVDAWGVRGAVVRSTCAVTKPAAEGAVTTSGIIADAAGAAATTPTVGPDAVAAAPATPALWHSRLSSYVRSVRGAFDAAWAARSNSLGPLACRGPRMVSAYAACHPDVRATAADIASGRSDGAPDAVVDALVAGAYEPPFTNNDKGHFACLDYMFVTPSTAACDAPAPAATAAAAAHPAFSVPAAVIGALSLATSSTCGSAGLRVLSTAPTAPLPGDAAAFPMPSAGCPSDHLPIAAELAVVDGSS